MKSSAIRPLDQRTESDLVTRLDGFGVASISLTDARPYLPVNPHDLIYLLDRLEAAERALADAEASR